MVTANKVLIEHKQEKLNNLSIPQSISLQQELETVYKNNDESLIAKNMLWMKENISEAIYLNGEMSTADIAPFRNVDHKLIPFSLPQAEPLIMKGQKGHIVDQIIDIMLRKSIRRGTKGQVLPFVNEIIEQIKVFVKNDQPISFVLPTLPFKDQSPFGTAAQIDHVDLGEYCFFAQIKRILEAIQSIYSPGAHMTLLCDGYIYADIFVNGNKLGAGQYKAKCEEIKNAYGLCNQVTLIDMREVFFNFPYWKTIEQQIRDGMWVLYNNDEDVKHRIDFLARRFVYYTALPNVSYEEARFIYSQKSLPKFVSDILLDSAVKYASIHLTMRKLNLIKTVFPQAIRCTVHPKAAAQLPLHLTNSSNDLLPYNGVAVVSRDALNRGMSLFQALRVRRLCDVLRYSNVIGVHTLQAVNPFYYEIP